MKIGIDVGSRWVKTAMTSDGRTFEVGLIGTAHFYREHTRPSAGGGVELDAPALGIAADAEAASTGYGRNAVRLERSRTIPEIKAHVLGARMLTGLDDFVLIDVGGQDSKVARVIAGRLSAFETNDKCAASSGRYLENMAHVLGMSLEELGRHHEDPERLNSTCAIYGETEVVGKIAAGVPYKRIAAGVNRNVVDRVLPMLARTASGLVGAPGAAGPVVLVGGVALNGAVVRFLERSVAGRVVVPAWPIYTGALGAVFDAWLEAGSPEPVVLEKA
jgi:predicted CoA-substrate-specific enzyme activase